MSLEHMDKLRVLVEVVVDAVHLCWLLIFCRNWQKEPGKKVLFVPTGALLSKTSFNEGDSIPGIAHAVVLEHVSKKDQKQ